MGKGGSVRLTTPVPRLPPLSASVPVAGRSTTATGARVVAALDNGEPSSPAECIVDHIPRPLRPSSPVSAFVRTVAAAVREAGPPPLDKFPTGPLTSSLLPVRVLRVEISSSATSARW